MIGIVCRMLLMNERNRLIYESAVVEIKHTQN